MKLTEFIENFIEHNSLIRLVYKIKNGHEVVAEDWDKVSMEHEVLKTKGIYRHYKDNKVLGICSILVNGPYSDAINIVIEKLENQPFVEETKEEEYYSQFKNESC